MFRKDHGMLFLQETIRILKIPMVIFETTLVIQLIVPHSHPMSHGCAALTSQRVPKRVRIYYRNSHLSRLAER